VNIRQFIRPKSGHEWLRSGRHAYSVTLARSGRVIEVVDVRADSEDEAATKAERYLAANIYALKIVKNEDGGGGDH
jgi:hypothetical protein